MTKISFDAWKLTTDNYCFAICGTGIDDLPDLTPLYRWYEEGITPQTAAKRTVRAAKKEYGF